MAVTVFDKLAAVNRVLRSAGEYPVNTLSDDGVNDTRVAEDLLDEERQRVLLTGKLCNTFFQDYVPDTNGKIILPATLLSVDSAGSDAWRNVGQSGSSPILLYDRDNNTDVFDTDLTISLRIVNNIPFEELPVAIRFEITDAVCVMYVDETVGDPNRVRGQQAKAFLSRALGRAADMRAKDRNIFRGASRNARQAGKRDWNYRPR